MTETEAKLHSYLKRRRSPVTANRYVSEFRKLARYTGKETDFAREDLLGYFDYLFDGKINPRTIHWTYLVLKRVFKILDLSYSLELDDMPVRDDSLPLPPVIAVRDAIHLIRVIREYGTVTERFYLMMSTLYGLRRIELSRLTISSFNQSLSQVHIDTAKGGLKRDHAVPDGVRHIIRTAIAAHVVGNNNEALQKIFHSICRKSHYKRKKGEGYHAIRRALDTALIDAKLPLYLLRNFLRWKPPADDMAGRYYRPDPWVVDSAVFKVHPFLKAWLE